MLHPAAHPLLPAGQLTAAAPSIMAARLPAGPGRRGGELEALFLLLLWLAAADAAASPEPPPKCEELRLGQYPERGRGALLWRWAGVRGGRERGQSNPGPLEEGVGGSRALCHAFIWGCCAVWPRAGSGCLFFNEKILLDEAPPSSLPSYFYCQDAQPNASVWSYSVLK